VVMCKCVVRWRRSRGVVEGCCPVGDSVVEGLGRGMEERRWLTSPRIVSQGYFGRSFLGRNWVRTFLKCYACVKNLSRYSSTSDEPIREQKDKSMYELWSLFATVRSLVVL
jgi:hypothetical protein